MKTYLASKRYAMGSRTARLRPLVNSLAIWDMLASFTIYIMIYPVHTKIRIVT
jgi:hypothetical protein